MQRDHKHGTVARCDGELVFYVELTSVGPLAIGIERLAGAPEQSLQVDFRMVEADGVTARTVLAPAIKSNATCIVRGFRPTQPGTWQIRIKASDGGALQKLAGLQLSDQAAVGAKASTVERRNASSVHLAYAAPEAQKDDIEWFYCEATPVTDPLWTYYMATGWHRGYFGMQVNSKTERRVIFSVWDSGNEAVDRSKVKAEDLVQLVKKGDGVHADGFGNEGTGGHSHLVHDWKLGDTIRFAVRAQVVDSHTIYTGWFSHVHADAKDQAPDPWQLVASFNAPRDGKYLHGLYSFSENFSGSNGDRDRQCDFGNIWLRSKDGAWLSVREAKFTHDGHGKIRTDRHGGVRSGRFYLQHGNFLAKSMQYGTKLTLPEGAAGKPPQLPQ